jgi:hypothetical protein
MRSVRFILWVRSSSVDQEELVKNRNLIKGIGIASPLLFVMVLPMFSIPARGQDKTIATRDGSCMATVPASWVVGSFPGSAGSADKKVSIIISTPRNSNFGVLKDNARKLYPNDKVTKDSATEFEMEGKSMDNKPNVYRGIAAGGKVCIGEVTYESGTVEDARKIVGTLKLK